MGNMLLAMPTISDSAIITGSSTAGDLPITNLKTAPIGQTARFLTPSAVNIQANISGEINLIAVLGHNGSATGTARVLAATTEAALDVAPDYDSGLLPIRSNQPDYTGSNISGAMETNHFIHFLPSALDYQFWRVELSDPSLTYLDVGRFYLSKAWQPETNMDYGCQIGWVDPSTSSRTVSGRIVTMQRPKYRYVDFQLSFASEQEMYDNAFEIDRLRGTSKDVLFINDPDAMSMIQKRSVYGTMQSLSPIINAHFSLFEKSFRIEEIIE